MTGILNLLAGAVSSVIKDTYFNLVTLLLPGNGTNGAQNNTFLDSSSNNFTITRNGNTTQGTFSPFSQTGWSNYFDGNGDWLTAPNNAVFAYGTGDFTVEAWLYKASSGTQAVLDMFNVSTPGTFGFNVADTAINAYQTNGTLFAFTYTFPLNSWNHVAFVRTSGTLYLYVNGSLVSSQACTNSFTNTNVLAIGRNDGGASQYWSGYISNLRLVKGQALYTSSFTPSTTPLTTTSQGATASNVSLLTCQSNRFIDNSTNAFTITRNGDVSVQAFSPFAPTAAYSASTVGGSGYFDGSGDYLNTAANAAFDFGTGAFTVEAWFYPSDTTSDGIVATSNNTAWGCVWIWTFGTEVRLRATASTSGADLAIGGGAFQVNAWNHVAGVRSGNDFSLYLNGTRVATGTSTTALKTGCNAAIGCMYDNSYNSFYSGYIASVRMVKGGALYSGTTYTIPTAPFTTSVSAGTVSLLTNFTNAGITDATAKNDLETVGNAQISTAQNKFGGSSMYFDGTGDSCYIPDTPNLKFGTGDLTIECWVYPTATPGGQGAQIIGRHEYGSNAEWIFQITSTSKLNIYLGASNVATSTGSISNNQWTHIACTRSGSSVRLFINGTIDGTGTYSGSSENGMSGAYTIGSDQAGDEAMYTGYIDDLRVTKGYARYTANFTIPSSAYPLQ